MALVRIALAFCAVSMLGGCATSVFDAENYLRCELAPAGPGKVRFTLTNVSNKLLAVSTGNLPVSDGEQPLTSFYDVTQAGRRVHYRGIQACFGSGPVVALRRGESLRRVTTLRRAYPIDPRKPTTVKYLMMVAYENVRSAEAAERKTALKRAALFDNAVTELPAYR